MSARILTIIIWAVGGLLYLTLPSSADQFDHNYMGWLITEGFVPYRDFVDQNWPLLFWMHAIGFKIFGNELWVWRLTDYLLLLLSTLFAADILRQIIGRKAQYLAYLLIPLAYIGLPQWYAGQHDVTPGHFLVIAIWFHIKGYKNDSPLWQLGTGAMLTAAILFKPTMGVMGLLLFIHPLLHHIPLKKVIHHSVILAATTLVLTALGFGIVFLQGAELEQIINCAWTYNTLGRTATNTYFELLERFLIVHLQWWHGITLISAVSVFICLSPSKRTLLTTTPLLLWLTGLISYSIQGTATSFHLGPCLQALLIMTVAGIAWAWQSPGVIKKICTAVLALSFISIKLSNNYSSLIQAYTAKTFQPHFERFRGTSTTNMWDTIKIARYVEINVPPEETVLSIGMLNAINFLSMRKQPSRFYYTPLIMTLKSSFPLAKRWADEWRDDLFANPPSLCIIPAEIYDDWLISDARAANYLRQLLEKEYRRIEAIPVNESLRYYTRSSSP